MKSIFSAICVAFLLLCAQPVIQAASSVRAPQSANAANTVNALSAADVQRIYDDGEYAFRRGFWPGALERYDAVIASDSASLSADASFRKAQCLYYMGDVDAALYLFNSLSEKPSSTRFAAYLPYWRGLMYYEKGAFSEAAALLEQGAGAPPDQTTQKDTLMYLARSYDALGKYPESMNVLERLVVRPDVGADFISVLDLLFESYARQNLAGRSIELYKKLDIALLPSEVGEKYTLYAADAYASSGRTPEALALYGSLTGSSRKDIAVSALMKAYLLNSSGGGSPAALDALVADAGQVLKDYPGVLGEFWGRLGIDAFSAGDRDKAASFFEKYYEASAGSPALKDLIPLYSAEIIAGRDGNEAALRALSASLPGAESYRPWYLLSLARYAAALGDWKQVLGFTQTFLDEGGFTESAGTFGDSGTAQMRGVSRDAALRTGDMRSEMIYLNAQALFHLGRYGAAAAVLVPFLETDGAGSPTQREKLVSLCADALISSGRNAEAITLLENLSRQNVGGQSVVSENGLAGGLSPGDALRLVYARLFTRDNAGARRLAERVMAEPSSSGGKSSPIYRAALYSAGLAAVNMSDWKAASAYLGEYSAGFRKKDVSGDQWMPYAVYYASYSTYRMGDFAGALPGFTSYLDMWPYTALSWSAAINGALCALQSGNPAASEFAERAAHTARTSAEKDQSVLLLAGILSDAKQYARGIEILLPVADGTGDYAARALYLLADMYAGQGSRPQADETWERVMLRFPADPVAEQACFRRAEFYYGVSEWKLASEYFAEYRRSYPEGRFIEAAQYLGGDSLARSGNRESAILQWENLLKTRPDTTYAYATLGNLMDSYRASGDYQSAYSTAQTLLKRFPSQAVPAGVQKQSDELRLLVQGIEEKTAVQLARFNAQGRTSTPEGRKTGLELASLYASSPSTRDTAVTILKEISMYRDDVSSVAPAELLLGRCLRESENYADAAAAFLKAADYYAVLKDEKAAEALYGAVDAFDLSGRTADARAVYDTMKTMWPGSAWTERASALVQ